MKDLIKIVLLNIVRGFLYLFSFLFPVKKNRLFFTAFNGNRYGCNPKYIFNYLYERHREFEYIWCLNDYKMFPSGYKVKLVKINSPLYIYYNMTSKIIITNGYASSFIPVRKTQTLIYTWHGGGAYKKIGLVGSELKRKRYEKYKLKKLGRSVSAFISSCKKFSEVMSGSLFVPIDKFLPIGMPRNDIFLKNGGPNVADIKEKLKISEEKGIILYAPTFRGAVAEAVSRNDIDIKSVTETLGRRFGKNFVFVYRAHYFIKRESVMTDDITDASDYPDMQELLSAADILITDYSSSMWDFSFTGKPCFLYVPDIDNYKKERDFYIPIETWGFPLAVSNEELKKNILNFDFEKYKSDIKNHHAALGSYETGKATAKICDYILKRNNL